MIEIIQQYWQQYLWTDGFQMTGVAMTSWLLVLSIAIGFVLSIPLSIARVSSNPLIRGPVWLFTYVFRGTPLYVQLLIRPLAKVNLRASNSPFQQLNSFLDQSVSVYFYSVLLISENV